MYALIGRGMYAGAVSDMWRHSKKKDNWNPGRVAHQTRYRHSDLGLLASVLSYFSHVRLFVTLWTVALQAPLSMVFSRQEYWSGLPWPSPGDLPDPGIEPVCLKLPALAGMSFTTSTAWEVLLALEIWKKNSVIQPTNLWLFCYGHLIRLVELYNFISISNLFIIHTYNYIV